MSRKPPAASRASPAASAVPTRFGQAIVLDRGQVQLFSGDAFAAMFPEIAVPRLPFIGAYAVRVRRCGGRSRAAAGAHGTPGGSARRWSCRFRKSSASAPGCSSSMPPICPGEAEKSPLWIAKGASIDRDTDTEPAAWQDQLFDVLKRADIRQVGYVPDAGHSRLIARCKADPDDPRRGADHRGGGRGAGRRRLARRAARARC